MSERSKRKAAARQAAARQAARPAATAPSPAATAKVKPKKKGTKIQWTKEQRAKIISLTKENLERHNFKYYPRRRWHESMPSESSFWAEATVILPPIMPSTRPYPEERFRLKQPTVVGKYAEVVYGHTISPPAMKAPSKQASVDRLQQPSQS